MNQTDTRGFEGWIRKIAIIGIGLVASAPAFAQFTGATLFNRTGTASDGPYLGAPYITVTGSSPLAPGSSVSFPVKFSYSGTAPISFVSKTISGIL
jgi:hypothetical protein